MDFVLIGMVRMDTIVDGFGFLDWYGMPMGEYFHTVAIQSRQVQDGLVQRHKTGGKGRSCSVFR